MLEERCVPATITPTTFADGGLGSGSLRDAVLQLNADTGTADDTIHLQGGTYALTIRNAGGRHETAGLTGDLNLTQAGHRWIIEGAGSTGPNATIIDASQLQDRVFDIVTPGTQVVFKNLVIQGGLAQDDGSAGALAGSTDALGGGVLNNGSAVTLDHVVLQNNMAQGGDAAVLSAPGHNARGGGFYSTGGALTLVGATLANNQAVGGRGGNYDYYPNPGGDGGSGAGGGLYATGGSLDIANSSIASNQATGGQGGDGYLAFTYGSYYYTGGGTGGAGQGGGLYVNGASLTIATSTIASNQGTGGSGGLGGGYGVGQGGGLYNGGTLTVSNSTLSGNSGGGIYNPGTLTVSNSTLSGNSGSGIYNPGTLTVSNSTLSGNSGSGIDNYWGTLTVSNSTLSGNSGSGIDNYWGTLTVSNSTLSGNSSGGIYTIHFYGTVTVSNSTLSGNSTAGDGGGIYNDGGPLTVTGSTLSDNSARSGGGIANVNGGQLTVSNSTVSGNSATGGYGGGGGIYNAGTLTVSNSTVSGNSATGFASGGGIYNAGTLTVSNSTLSGNSAFGGGGIYHPGYYGTLTVSNSTLAGNFATGSGYGGGGGGILSFLYSGQGTITLTNVTLAGNRAITSGGGLFVYYGGPVLHNTLIAGNFRGATGTTRDDVYGALDPGGDHNLIGDGTGMTGLSNGVHGNQIGSATAPIDPLLGPLQDNGGPTKTMALLAGSPALNAGDPAQLGVADQRGVVLGGGVNIGAYQASASTFVLTAPSTATAGTPFNVTVKAVDRFGQTAVGYTGTVHFSSADGQAVLPGDYTFTSADAGLHSFTVTLKTAGSQSVTATDTVTNSITGSASVSVTAAAADHLLFLQQPTNTAAGQTMSPVILEVVDAFGNVVTGDNSETITLSIGNNPTGGTLSGTLTVTVVNGVATFGHLSIDLAGAGYTLHATVAGGGVPGVDSNPFNITT
jgi:hypothetical protein